MTTRCTTNDHSASTQRPVRRDQVLANQPPITRARYLNIMESSRPGRRTTARSASENQSRVRIASNSTSRRERNGESTNRVTARQQSDNPVILDVQIAQSSLERHQHILRDAILQNTLSVSVTPSPASNSVVPNLANTSVNINQTTVTEPTDTLPDIISSNSMRRPSISIVHSSRTDDNQNLERDCSECCFSCVTLATSLRWVLIGLAMFGVCCVAAGIVLGSLHVTLKEQSFLTLSLMFIGLGILLVIIVGFGWRCSTNREEPCHALFGLGDYATPGGRRRRMTSRPERNRGGGSLPSRRPHLAPPTYEQSQLDHIVTQIRLGQTDQSLPSTAPPSYRSRVSTRPQIVTNRSNPPSYRSRQSTIERPSIFTTTTDEALRQLDVVIASHGVPDTAL
ncbi:DgyrCDS7294 [Dimorphilus gyrociliatus]|uniref:DgyrCDS7294 n=1 Tax=Dimorphilus gyrociliatus TaxID=2664684 RepID=A0A7I8VSW3_9ANNE|nr:DgyrCDS7294 [Dimorphilus gyrociliatus]